MRPFLPPLFLVTLCGAWLLACSSEPQPRDPKTLPYTLKPVFELGQEAQAVDLDGDGVDEVVKRNWGGIRAGGSAILLARQDGGVIEQVNYAGQIPAPVHFLDYDGDGDPEIFVPFVRDDSLFVSVVDARGKKGVEFFLTEGEPRQEDGSVLAWDPSVECFYAEDLDGDGQDELVTVIKTAYARLPRGVLVHRLSDGLPLGRAIVGSFPSRTFFGDFDGDGVFEIVAQGVATNNGARAGGLDDRHSYIIMFELTPTPAVAWSRRTGDRWTEAHLAYEDFDGDGDRAFLSFVVTSSSRSEQARLSLIEPGTWRTVQQRTFAERLQWPQTIDLDGDARPEVVAARLPGEVWAFDAGLDVVQRRRVASNLEWLETVPDLNGDGLEEIVALTPNGRLLLLDPALRVKAAYALESGSNPRGQVIDGLLRRGLGIAPYLLVRDWGGNTVALELVENRMWWLYHYGPVAGWVLGIIAMLGAVTGGRSLYRRTQLLERVYPVAVDASDRGVLVLDADGRVVLMNAALCEWLGLGAARPVKGEPLGAVLGEAPALAAFLRRVIADDPPRHHAEEIALGANGQQHVHYVTADPVALQNGSAPHWLVTLAQGRRDATYLDARLWAAMAEEITHKLRNALGAILLEAEELQVAYREQVPTASEALDPYTERIAERVEALRRETLQLLSIHDVEALTLTRSDLSSVVRDVEETLARDRPPRAELRFRLGDGLPAVVVDRERIQAALENLVSNAFRAVSGGGVVTVSTYAVPNLQRAQTGFDPADYAVLEVRDNGTGIARVDLRSIFEPGFSTAEFGTGLGLALVQRIAAHHGGFVKVESEESVGSLFSLYLPVAEPIPRNA